VHEEPVVVQGGPTCEGALIPFSLHAFHFSAVKMMFKVMFSMSHFDFLDIFVRFTLTDGVQWEPMVIEGGPTCWFALAPILRGAHHVRE
jgi:hypothetical protein